MTHGPSFSGRLGWGRAPALLVVDMVRAYFEPDGPLYLDAASTVDGCDSLVDAARHGGRRVVWTVVRYAADGSDGGWWVRKVPALAHLVAGAPGGWGDLVEPLSPRSDEPVLVKQYASAFFGTSLASTLTAAGVDTVVVCGVSTSGCVRASATDALQHGFRPMVVRQACGDRTSAIGQSNLDDLDAKYADVVDLAEAEKALRAG
ncbi:MAG: isochorismatase family protein [Pseudonocardiaceae bacterium]|nr:isochorismatase family protein [Pseudonocardiaceae bacterium]